MQFLKNFNNANTVKPQTTVTTGIKSSYFSSLNQALQPQKSKQKQKGSKQNIKKSQGPVKGFIPQKFALDFDCPTIIIQYRDPQSSKLYHHKMLIKRLTKQTPTKLVLDYLKKKHYHYFIPKVIDQTQIQKLIQKLKSGMIGDNQKEQLGNVDEEDFDFDYQDDFDV